MFKEFKLTKEENETATNWALTHNCTCQKKSSCGSEVSITFTPTSIGTAVELSCVCGAKFSLREL